MASLATHARLLTRAPVGVRQLYGPGGQTTVASYGGSGPTFSAKK